MNYKTNSSKIIHQNPFYKIIKEEVEWEDSRKDDYYILDKGKAVFVIAENGSNKILLIRQFRYQTKIESWELPAGSIEKGESSIEAAKRELWEETGYEAQNFKIVNTFQSFNGASSETYDVVIAKNLSETDINKMEEENISEVKAFSINEIEVMIQQGEVSDAQSIAALYQYKLKKT